MSLYEIDNVHGARAEVRSRSCLYYTQTQDPRSQSLRAQVREFELAYASVFFKNFLLREIHKANFRRDVIYTFSSFKDGEAFENIRDFEFFSWI